MKPPIILLTDFGRKDPYVGIMKGVMKSIDPCVSWIDLTHDVPPQQIEQGAFWLTRSVDYFPKGSIFLCVVDPGVGSKRRAISIRTKHFFFVGPDNGLMQMAASQDSIKEIRELKQKKFWRCPNLSSTFHGRDLFAPVAAHLSCDSKVFSKLGPKVTKLKNLDCLVTVGRTKSVIGKILYFDQFGNAITNLYLKDANLSKKSKLKVGSRSFSVLGSSYHQGKGLGILKNSFDCVEIAYPNGSAQKQAKLKCHQKVVFSRG